MTKDLPCYVKKADNGWYLLVRVQPGAKKSLITTEVIEDRLKVRISAQPVENKANKELILYISKVLKVKPNKISLSSGDTSRNKTLFLCVEDIDWTLLFK